MTTAWKRRDSAGLSLWLVPEDALALFAVDNEAPTWAALDAWALKCRGNSGARIEVTESTLPAVLASLRSRAKAERHLGTAVLLLRNQLAFAPRKKAS